MAAGLAPGFSYSGKHRLSYDEVKRLAKAFGLPGDAIAQIAKGESGLKADIQQRDPGDGMVGYGLLQMTPNAWGKGSAAYKHMQSLGGIEAMKDPVKNMAMARFLYKSAGNKLSPWYGTRFLTNRSGEGTLGPVRHDLIPPSSGGPAASAASAGTPSRTITETTPGVDNSAARRSLVLDFLGNKNSDVLDFAVQAKQLADIPGTSTTRTIPGTPGTGGGGSPDAPSSNTGPHPKFGKSHSPLLELIHSTGNGPGYAVKHGQKVDGRTFYASVWAGHADHVHVAAGPKTIVQLGRLAQQMGLHVGENPHFGGVDPVHVPGSYHYKGEAIDVSGDPQKMNAYARRVERLYGIH